MPKKSIRSRPFLSLEEQAELLACRYQMIASMVPPKMVMPISLRVLTEVLSTMLRVKGAQNEAFIVTLRKQAIQIEDWLVNRDSDDEKGGA